MGDLRIIEVTDGDTSLLEEFIASLGKHSSSFRYFEKRPLNIIENHLCTLLILSESEEPLAYGHLDKENDTIWLGIAVIEGMEGKGLGNAMMAELMERGRTAGIDAIRLSVDTENVPAMKLYEKLGFTVIKESEAYFLYELQLV